MHRAHPKAPLVVPTEKSKFCDRSMGRWQSADLDGLEACSARDWRQTRSRAVKRARSLQSGAQANAIEGQWVVEIADQRPRTEQLSACNLQSAPQPRAQREALFTFRKIPRMYAEDGVGEGGDGDAAEMLVEREAMGSDDVLEDEIDERQEDADEGVDEDGAAFQGEVKHRLWAMEGVRTSVLGRSQPRRSRCGRGGD